jgi:hypothetical protein
MRRLAPTAAAMLVAACLAACGGGRPQTARPSPTTTQTPATPASTPAPSDAPTPTGTPAPDRCHTGDLEVRIWPGQPVSNQGVFDIEVRNRSAAACSLDGYFGVAMVNHQGTIVERADRRTTSAYTESSGPPQRVLLPLGTAALGAADHAGHAWFGISYGLSCGDRQPHPAGDRWQLIAPADTATMLVPMSTPDPGGSQSLYCYLAVMPVEPQRYQQG